MKLLGHGKAQGEPENVFRLTSSPLTPTENLVDLFLVYLSRYPDLVSLIQAVGRTKFLQFLEIFSGVTFSVPKNPSEMDWDSLEMTLFPEIALIFGDETLEKFVAAFAGRDFKVPPSRAIHCAIRDVDIYTQIILGKGKHTVSALSQHYKITKSEVWWLFRRVSKVAQPELDEEEIRVRVDIPDELMEDSDVGIN